MEEKIPLQKDYRERLKIFFIITRPMQRKPEKKGWFGFLKKEKGPFLPDGMMMNKEEHVNGILAYRPEEAMEFIKSKIKPDMMILWTGDFAFIDEIIKKVGEVERRDIKMEVVSVQTPRMNFDGWKNSVLMMANEFVQDEAQRKTLIEIVSLIKEKV